MTINDLADEFGRQLFGTCRAIVPSDYSDNMISHALRHHFMTAVLPTYLDNETQTSQDNLTVEEELQVCAEISQNMQYDVIDFQNYEISTPADACLTLFGDAAYEQMFLLNQQLREQALRVQHGDEEPCGQEFYDATVTSIRTIISNLTEYGRELSEGIICDCHAYLAIICSDAKHYPIKTEEHRCD